MQVAQEIGAQSRALWERPEAAGETIIKEVIPVLAAEKPIELGVFSALADDKRTDPTAARDPFADVLCPSPWRDGDGRFRECGADDVANLVGRLFLFGITCFRRTRSLVGLREVLSRLIVDHTAAAPNDGRGPGAEVDKALDDLCAQGVSQPGRGRAVLDEPRTARPHLRAPLPAHAHRGHARHRRRQSGDP